MTSCAADVRWKAWEITCCGITGVAVAQKRGRARYIVAKSASENGYARTVGEALVTIRCSREPRYDAAARELGQEGFIGHEYLHMRATESR